MEEKAEQPVVLSTTPIHSVEDELKKKESLELSSGRCLDSGSNWQQIKQEICIRKPVFKHYLEQCKVLAFSESKLDLGFIDAITLDQVKNQENLQLVKDAVKLVCDREINITLVLSDKASVPVTNSSSGRLASKEINMNSSNQGQDKSEAEIIQDALDVFGGVVIK